MRWTLLAQLAPSDAEPFTSLLAQKLWILIPIVGMLTWGAVTIVRTWVSHRERLAMIQQGINPDEMHAIPLKGKPPVV